MMHRRKWLCAFTLVPSFALSLLAQEPKSVPVAETTPEVKATFEVKPGEVVKVPPHSSKWDYPKEFTLPPGTQYHSVVRGDTLWDLGNQYLGNPYAWPQIWEQNKWIKDPHWIYPGDPLVIPVAKQVVGRAAAPEDVTAPGDVANLGPDRPVYTGRRITAEYAFAFPDFLQLPVLAPQGAEPHYAKMGAFRIVDGEVPDRANMGDGDRLYLDGGSSKGLKVGDRLVVMRTVKQRLFHPDDQRRETPIGDVVQNVGVLRVLQTTERGAVALIERTLDGVQVGDRAALFTEPSVMPMKLRNDIQDPIPLKQPQIKVVYCRGDHEFFANGEMVIVDKGNTDRLSVGDILLAARERSWSGDATTRHAAKKEKTNRYLGQLMVVAVGEKSATCRILRAVEDMQIGDILTK